MNEEFSDILETLHPERIATGFVFTEGPVWHNGFTYFVDIRQSQQLRWSRDTGTELFRENTGEGNGTTVDRQGRMVICEGANRRVTRQNSDGTWKSIAGMLDGRRLNRPNDVVCRSDGSIYFTDPAGRLTPKERDLDFSGVIRVSPDGQLSVATYECEYPNGLAFSPDETTLYVSISRLNEDCIVEKERGEVCQHQFIRAFDVQPNGSLTNNRIFAYMSSSEEGVPDGMKVDTKGRIYCTGPGGCWVYTPEAKLVGVIKLPEVPANLAFGGTNNQDIYFTARTSLYLMRAQEPGISILP
mgnify:FL=1